MKRYYLITSLVLLCLLLFGVGHRKASAADHAVVILYHHFGDTTPPSTSVTLDQFDRHLDYLEQNDFTIWPLSRIISQLKAELELPDRCLAITIDDAYISIFTEAFPRLQKRNWPFTVFVATQAIDNGGEAFLTWKQMRRMQQAGVEFASHSHTHPYMVQRRKGETESEWEERIRSEIEISRKRLHQELGSQFNLFAYPYGEYDLKLKKIVEEMGLTGIAQHSGAIGETTDWQAVPRFPMAGRFAEMDDFRIKVNTLPLPVIEAHPEETLLTPASQPPTLRLRLAPGQYRPGTLACYASGQGHIDLEWIDQDNRLFECTAHRPLPKGRSLYNCTAAHTRLNRYFWYSHLWIR